ncbi:MAG: hypothetical protein E7813_22080 [Bradyrhizobium sp.]|uniref:hypothetical protein n=1 Tax=Bradyrhizobium sp. TaxID=376 RepID=UPI001201B1BA|nr:hypothetical protein [Bradyrhizobium sp.]THD61137.1 MAG: hypothetical protein E7813_22080 [Bradyrhizobium sp.]
MGDLLPNGNDIDVINQLTTRFTASPFSALKHYVSSSHDDFLWGNGKSLARASFRLNIWPTSGPKAKARWFAFLARILSRQNQIDIQNALKTAVENSAGNIVGVHFWAQFDATIPQNTYVVRVTREAADAIGNVFLRITLLCDHEIPAGEAGDPNPGPDLGEIGPVHPLAKKKKKPGKGKKPGKKKVAKKRTAKKRAAKKRR